MEKRYKLFVQFDVVQHILKKTKDMLQNCNKLLLITIHNK